MSLLIRNQTDAQRKSTLDGLIKRFKDEIDVSKQLYINQAQRAEEKGQFSIARYFYGLAGIQGEDKKDVEKEFTAREDLQAERIALLVKAGVKPESASLFVNQIDYQTLKSAKDNIAVIADKIRDRKFKGGEDTFSNRDPQEQASIVTTIVNDSLPQLSQDTGIITRTLQKVKERKGYQQLRQEDLERKKSGYLPLESGLRPPKKIQKGPKGPPFTDEELRHLRQAEIVAPKKKPPTEPISLGKGILPPKFRKLQVGMGRIKKPKVSRLIRVGEHMAGNTSY